MVVAHQKSLIVFAGAFPFEHAGGISVIIRIWYSEYLFLSGCTKEPELSFLAMCSDLSSYFLDSVKTKELLVAVVGHLCVCSSQGHRLDDAITMAPLRFWYSGTDKNWEPEL